MTLYWPNYQSFPRIALVRNETEHDSQTEHEQGEELLIIAAGRLCFSSDGYSTEIVNDSPLYQLNSGDIITIDDRGIIYRLFSIEEEDATVFVIGHCNSNCIMCPSSESERRGDGGLPKEWLLRYLRLLPQRLGHITVTGGEPTLRKGLFFELMSAIADGFPETEVLLLTNGRSFASLEFTERLTEHCPPYLCAAIPIHGSDAALHDKITQSPGSFAQTMAGIGHFLAKGISVELRIVVSRLNVHDLTHIAEYVIRNFPNIMVVNFIGLETRGNCAKNFKEVYIDFQESAKAILPAANLLASAGIDTALYNYPLCMVDRGYWMLCKQSISPDKVRFAPECAGCEAKSLCGGFFNTTLSMVNPNVLPVKF